MQLRAAAATDVGMRRGANEDRYALAPELGLFLARLNFGLMRLSPVFLRAVSS